MIFATAAKLQWLNVLPQAQLLFAKHASPAKELANIVEGLPQDGFLDLWRKEKDGRIILLLNTGDWISREVCDQWKAALGPHCDELRVEAELGGPMSDGWVKIAFAPSIEYPYQVKDAASKILRTLGMASGYLPGGWADSIGGPSPLSGMLGGGLIGAGLGYGAGWLGEQAMPRNWQRGRLRRTLALMGGLAGAAPGAAMMAENYRTGRDLNSGVLTNYPATSAAMNYAPTLEDGSDNPDYDPEIPYVPEDYLQAAQAANGEVPPVIKAAFSRTGYELEESTLLPPPLIPLDQFNYHLYQDPLVASQLSPATQAAASGLLEAAYQSRGGGPRLIGPADVARISAGMGSGYLSGAIVGKALGTLMGMPESAQNHLRQTGMWAGVVANLIPLAFGAR